jgi:hypothetical protein
MMPLSRGLSSGRTLASGHREACCGLKIWLFHPHDSTKTPILYDALPAATSVTGSASSMIVKWFGAVSTRITLCRSDFSVSILWALAASAMAMVKAMVFCMSKFPPIPASLQKTSGYGRIPACTKARGA